MNDFYYPLPLTLRLCSLKRVNRQVKGVLNYCKLFISFIKSIQFYFLESRKTNNKTKNKEFN